MIYGYSDKAMLIGLGVFTLGITALYLLVIWYTLIGGKIRKKTYQLSKNLNHKKVEDYINYIDKITIPPRIYHHYMLQSGYEIVKMNKDIDTDIKEQLKIALLSKGVLIR